MLSFDPMEYPFASRRNVVYAARGAVCTSHPLAAQAGLAVLRTGGNAADAAVATACALSVLEPCSNGIGGDAFALIWSNGRLHGLNASGWSPAALTHAAAQAQTKADGTLDPRAWACVTVPGAPAGWAALNRMHGCLPLERCMQPAIEYARLGAPLAPNVAQGIAGTCEQYAAAPYEERFAGWFDTFAPGGCPPRAGELLRLPDHADTLEDIAATAARSFYEGALMRRMVAFARQTGGYWDEADFAQFTTRTVEPLSVGYRGYDIHELPPNGQGLAALLALQLLEGFETEPFASPAALHCEVEAMKLAFADAACHIADPAHMRTTPQALLDPGYAAARRALIGARAAQYGPGPAPDHGTVYLCTADAHGNMVSMIQSNYMGFGSGMVVPGTGIALHNRGHNFSLEAGHANCIGPRKYPYHTIIPGFITRGGQPVGCFGVMGGFMQPQGHVQVVRNLIDHGMNPQAALDAPRWRWDVGLRIALESAFDPRAVQALAALGHEIVPAYKAGFFGRGQILLRGADGVYAAGCDGRCDSQVAAW